MTSVHSDDLILQNFKSNVEALLAKHGMSHAELSHRAGLPNDTDISVLLNSTTLPNMAVPMRVARAFDVSVDVLLQDPSAYLSTEIDVTPLMEVEQHAANLLSSVFKATDKTLEWLDDRPTMDSMIAWWKETGGDLTQCDQLSPHFDLVKAALSDDELPEVKHVGALGLSAQTLMSTESQRLRRFLATLNEVDLAELNVQIRNVTRSGVGLISPQTRVVERPERRETIEVSFVRLMLPVTDAFGQPYVLNYATLLSESTPNRQQGFSLKN